MGTRNVPEFRAAIIRAPARQASQKGEGAINKPRAWAEFDPAMPPLTRALTEDIRNACDHAGRPSFRQIKQHSMGNGVVLTLPTLNRIFTPRPDATDQSSLPEWVYYEALLRIFQRDADAYRDRWDAAQREWRARPPQEPHRDEPAAHHAHSDVAAAEPAPRLALHRRPAVLITSSVVATGLLAGAIAVMVNSRWPDPLPGGNPVAATPAPTQPDPRMDNTDPEATGCSSMQGEQTYYSHLFLDWPDARQQSAAVITLHYSVTCRTVWAVLTGATPGATATLHRNSDHRELKCTAGPDGSCATKQLSDINVTSYASAQVGNAYGRTRSF
jgi:hypothetical protein